MYSQDVKKNRAFLVHKIETTTSDFPLKHFYLHTLNTYTDIHTHTHSYTVKTEGREEKMAFFVFFSPLIWCVTIELTVIAHLLFNQPSHSWIWLSEYIFHLDKAYFHPKVRNFHFIKFNSSQTLDLVHCRFTRAAHAIL